ncbi:MAG TPA: protein kinase [Ktedonobacteraceae bacterium]|nr:protein kinase [Ktedonobacteraceae bacterium]
MNLITSGGMGEIYLADETSIGRQVAMKVIRPEVIKYPNSEDARRMLQLFRREASAIARLNHPDILPLYRFGEATVDEIPLMFMVMPYCEERALTDWLYKHSKTTLTAQEVEPIVRQAAEALQYAHEQGVIHLDVKPSNFLVRYPTDDVQRLNVQLADFGVAKFTATGGMSQTVRGSLEAMAPEQWEGSPVYATDQYALAVMIYKLLTGKNPFQGTSFEQLWHQHRTAQLQPPSTVNPAVPRSIDAVLMRGMAKNPQDRYPSMLAFADAYHLALQPTKEPNMQFNLTPIPQSVTVTENDARMGASREVILPSGERLSIYIPPGTFPGRIIPIERPGMPTVLVTVNVTQNMTPPLPPPPPLEKTQLATPPGFNPQGQWNQGQLPNPQTQWGGPQGQTPNSQGQWNQGQTPSNPQEQWNRGQTPNSQGQWNQGQTPPNPQQQWNQVQGANAQTQWGQGAIPPIPVGQGQPTPPPARPKRARIFVLAVIAILVIIAAVIGIFTFTTVQHNQQVAATATAQNQTQVAQNNLNGTATQSAAIATATQGAVNATATAANTFPAVAGNYSGTLTNNANGGKQAAMALALQQNQGTLTGTCSIDSFPFPIQNGSVTLSGQVSFSITIPASGSTSASQFNFNGTRQSNGSLTGTYTASQGGEGPWSVTKS